MIILNIMTFNIFKDSRALDFAHKFIIDERLSSLRKDVKECLDKNCAFPALRNKPVNRSSTPYF
jgi:hypothetical protein